MQSMPMRMIVAFSLLLIAAAHAQDAPESEQTNRPVAASKGPRKCQWAANAPLSFETTLASGEKARALRCGDYQMAVHIVQTDAFNFSERKAASLPITYALFNLVNHNDASLAIAPEQFKLVVNGKKNEKPISPYTLATAVQKGPGQVDFNKGSGITRDIFSTSQAAQLSQGTPEQRKQWDEQAQRINKQGLRPMTIPQDSNTTVALYFNSHKKESIAIKWTAPTGEVLTIPAP
jgi:hypothetical protein